MTNTQILTANTFYGGSMAGMSCTLPDVGFRVKDKLSALTHFIGLLCSIIGMPVLLIYEAGRGASLLQLISYGIFTLSMVMLYGASTAYHTFFLPEASERVLKKIDHMMIFVLITGTYTPVCLNYLPGNIGRPMLMTVAIFAVAGILFKALWVTCPKWISSVIYIGMGWTCIFAFGAIYKALSHAGFLWLLSGGIFYTIGGVIYALKLPLLRKLHPDFGAHELFHVFVMLGSFCHYMVMFQ